MRLSYTEFFRLLPVVSWSTILFVNGINLKRKRKEKKRKDYGCQKL